MITIKERLSRKLRKEKTMSLSQLTSSQAGRVTGIRPIVEEMAVEGLVKLSAVSSKNGPDKIIIEWLEKAV